MKSLSCCLLLLLPCLAHGQCKVVHAPPTYHHAPTVAYKSVKHYDAAFFPVATYVAVPLFAVTSAPVATAPAAAAQAPQATQEMKEVLNYMKAFDTRLRVLEGRLGGSPTPSSAPATSPAPGADPFNPGPKAGAMAGTPEQQGLALLGSKCASCHDDASKNKGGGLAFFKDGLVIAGDKWLVKMADSVQKSRMPEPGSGITMTAEERSLLVNLLLSQKGKTPDKTP